MKLVKSLAGALCLGLSLIATVTVAHDIKAGDLTVIHPHARPNLPNRPTAAYMVISNDGEVADRLLSAKSSSFGAVELHTTTKQGDVMQMRQVEGIDVPPGDSAVLEPGGLHVMLFDAEKAHKIGEEFMLELTFENAGVVEVNVKVEKIATGDGHEGHGNHGDHGDHSNHGHSTN